jgi:hypothetical protein
MPFVVALLESHAWFMHLVRERFGVPVGFSKHRRQEWRVCLFSPKRLCWIWAPETALTFVCFGDSDVWVWNSSRNVVQPVQG